MTGILSPTVKISVAYKKSFYQAGLVSTKINHYPKGIPEKLQNSTLVLFSAYNPGGRLKMLGWNMRMMKNLQSYLKKYNYVNGSGSLKATSEPLFMVEIPIQKAIFLARKFRQNAIVVIRYQRFSKLIFLV